MRVVSSAQRLYLSGADWNVTAVSRGTKDLTGRKVMFQVAVFVNGDPGGKRLEDAFRSFCGRFPLLWGRPARCWSLAPCWWQPQAAMPGLPIRVGRSSLPDSSTDENLVRHLETLSNRHAARPNWSVALDTVRMGHQRTVLVFSFDHRVFDGAGSEAFINLFIRSVNGTAEEGEFPVQMQAASGHRLGGWGRRFRSLRVVRRLMRVLGEGETCRLKLPTDTFNRSNRFRVETFDAAAAAQIREQACKVAVDMMLTPYLLATAATALRHVFTAGEHGKGKFVVTVMAARPSSGERPQRLFFNDSQLHYVQFSHRLAARRDELAVELLGQLVQQERDGVPDAIEESNLLMRILPVRWFWQVLTRFYRSSLPSFGMTILGETGISETEVLGCRVCERMHFPMMPVPPGIGLMLSQSNGGYHLVLSYIEGVLSDAEAAEVMSSLRAML